MKFQTLESSELKNKYFYRLERWDWLTPDMIHVVDSKSPRFITMDYWPQKIYLEAKGQRTVAEFIHLIASKYPRTGIPINLDKAILEELYSLVEEELIAISDSPVNLDSSILNPLTDEGKVNLPGTWIGTYRYNITDDFKDEKTKEVEFTINITSVKGKKFEGSVEDNLSTGGTPGIGRISGKYSDSEVSFNKNMPIYAEMSSNKEHVLDKNKLHPTIMYVGEFSRDKKTISGVWRFKKKVLVWKGIIPYWITPGTGDFTMRKKEQLLNGAG
ncbi:hypothetical protein J2X69_000374 [Algoriphagus sp. 4150]|uniref:hypothetical protein n=1 Tax=Algoriphagus sp. 4150 TaxID=2817756 RepID=UPI00285EF880|nr:hypothetical protein [Algoriphagus sp. 4150]MDR7128046.1 hypothetical protein [Algoriphagus sp. 4150]